MKRIIIYRYHNDVESSTERLEFIKKLNPETAIYGLFGGPEEEFTRYDTALSRFFEHNFCIRNKSGYWKWKNSDLVYRLWFKEHGHKIDFDSAIVLEWDLVMFEPVEKIYAHVNENEVGMTGLIKLPKIEKKWFWTRDPEQRKHWLQLLDHVKERYGYSETPFASLCPGVILPRNFLRDLSQQEIPELSHDELRLPLYAQVLGYKLVDLGFYKKWFSEKEWKYFNCNEINISPEIIKKEISQKKGRKVFHPFRESIFLSFPELNHQR